MKQTRLTREQRKEETRECLLAAARTEFIKNGYAATSVEDIAVAAGYTRGAFYSNFEGKLDMLMELLRRDHDVTQASFLSILGGSGTGVELATRIMEYYTLLSRDHASFPLWVEARLLAIRDTELREKLGVFTHERLDQAAACIRVISERTCVPLRLPAHTLAHGLVSLCDGVRLFQLGDPEALDGVSGAVLAEYLSGVVSR